MDKGVYYDALASGYDRLHRAEQQRKLGALIPQLGDISPFSWFLDVGCGTGVSFPSLKCAYKFGLDPSIELLKKVPKIQAANGCVVNGQGERLPFRNGTFDYVLCLTAFHNFDNPTAGIEEMRRVCKEDGTIIVTVLKKLKMTQSCCELIKSLLNVRIEMEEFHDHMFICDNKPASPIEATSSEAAK
jgi:ubiquinone/menaquinone biosynthesis C-methylase UbiE